MRKIRTLLVMSLALTTGGPLGAQRAEPVALTAAHADLRPEYRLAATRPSRGRYAAVGAAVGIVGTVVLIAKFGGEAGPGSAFAVIPVILGAGLLGALAGLAVHAARY